MSGFGLELTGVREAVLRFDSFPKHAHDRLLAALQSIETRLEAAVTASEPVGASSQLRDLTGGRVYDHETRIAAVVGVRVASGDKVTAGKAMALEYGAHRATQVRAHEAKLSVVWGRAISPTSRQVAAHGRIPNIAAVRYLRDPIEAMRTQALAELQAAIAEAEAESE